MVEKYTRKWRREEGDRKDSYLVLLLTAILIGSQRSRQTEVKNDALTFHKKYLSISDQTANNRQEQVGGYWRTGFKKWHSVDELGVVILELF